MNEFILNELRKIHLTLRCISVNNSLTPTNSAGNPITYTPLNQIVTGNGTIPANAVSYSLTVLDTTPVAWTFNGLSLNAADAFQIRNFSEEAPNGTLTPVNYNLSTNRALLIYKIRN